MKLIKILSAAPGSGKTTYIKNNFPDAVICSADHYFTDEAGNYNFDINKLYQAHLTCQKKFFDALEQNAPLIIIDNTNTRIKEIREYAEPAKKANYEVEVIFIITPTHIAHQRNTHGVPLETIEKMAERLENSINLCLYKHSIIKNN